MKKCGWKTAKMVLSIELIFFGYHYWFGKHGFSMVKQIQKEQQLLEVSIEKLAQEIVLLDQEVDNWKKYPFYQEKIAREQLHMARKDDKIYYIT